MLSVNLGLLLTLLPAQILEDYDSQMKYVLRELKLVSDEFEEEQKPR